MNSYGRYQPGLDLAPQMSRTEVILFKKSKFQAVDQVFSIHIEILKKLNRSMLTSLSGHKKDVAVGKGGEEPGLQ